MATLLVMQSGFGGFWSLIAQSGPIALLVLLVLLFFSIFSWTIIYSKVRAYRRVGQQSLEFYDLFRRSASLSEIHRSCENYPLSPLAGIFKRGYRELEHWIQAKEEGQASGPSGQPFKGLAGLERTLYKAATAEMTSLEHSLNWLATTGSVAPFIGLFGTVIGIINAFQGLGQGGTTTIQAVAPGISEALVATAAGLFAAIPAVIAYNHFLSQLKVFGVEMDDFTVELLNLIERSFS